MTALLEDPFPIILIGILVEAVLGVVLLRTGRGVIMLLMIGVAALVLAGVGLERLVVTEAERVEATLDEAAEALLAFDKPRLMACIAPSNAYSRQRAEFAFRVTEEITQVKINDLEIRVNRLTSPPTATAEFYGVISAKVKQYGPVSRPFRFVVDFRLENDRWLISGHEERDLRGDR